MFCPQCGENNAESANVCVRCGRVLQIAAMPGGQPAVSTTSGKAIASLVLGLFPILLIPSILAIVFGHIALSEIKKNGGRLQGRGIAIAGLILGYLEIAFIPIVLIIAAIAIPNLLRARIAANEASAVAAVRAVNVAESSYRVEHPDRGFTCSLADLRQANLERPIAGGRRYGYFFVMQNCSDGFNGPNRAYQIVAYPVQANRTGIRAFCSDESAVIKFDASGSAPDCLSGGSPLQ